MNRALDKMIEDGEICRKRVCARCGAVGYDQLRGWKKEEWREDEPDFGLSSFVSVFVPGYGPATLCQPCATEIKTLCGDFMRRPTHDAAEEK